MSQTPSVYGFALSVASISLLGGLGLTGIVYGLVWFLSHFNPIWLGMFALMSLVSGMVAWRFRAYEVVER